MSFAIIEKNKIEEKSVAGKYLPALINDDFSGLEESEIKALDNWKKEISAEIYTTEDYSDGAYARCTVSGLMAVCYTILCVTRAKTFESAKEAEIKEK